MWKIFPRLLFWEWSECLLWDYLTDELYMKKHLENGYINMTYVIQVLIFMNKKLSLAIGYRFSYALGNYLITYWFSLVWVYMYMYARSFYDKTRMRCLKPCCLKKYNMLLSPDKIVNCFVCHILWNCELKNSM